MKRGFVYLQLLFFVYSGIAKGDINNSTTISPSDIYAEFVFANGLEPLSKSPETAVQWIEEQARIVLSGESINSIHLITLSKMVAELNIKSFLWLENYSAAMGSVKTIRLLIEESELPFAEKRTLFSLVDQLESKLTLANDGNAQGVNEQKFLEFLNKVKMSKKQLCAKAFSNI